MEIYRYDHKAEYFRSAILNQYFPNMRIGIFDIETLGLNPAKVPVVLAGLMAVEPDGSCQMRQYFAEKPSEEKKLLQILQRDLNQFDYLLTYNGKHFDLPFIHRRAEACGLEDFSIRPYNLDLYLYLHGHSPIRSLLPNLKQKSVEVYMNLAPSRADEISGAESVTMYHAFLEAFEGDEKNDLRRQILLHNHDDILQLYKILPVILQTDIHKAAYSLGFPVASDGGWPQLNVGSVKLSGSELTWSGTYAGEPFLFSSYSSAARPYDCHFTLDREFQFALPVQQLKGNAFFNLQTYFPDTAAFEKYPGFVNGYLILSKNNGPCHLECNMLVQQLLRKFMTENPR